MRHLAALVLAVPVIAAIIIGSVLRRSGAQRAAIALGVGAVLGVGVISLVPAEPIVATPPSVPRTLTTAEFQIRVGVGHALREPVAIEFGSAMDAASVAAALRVEPATAVHLLWDEQGRRLTIQPVGHWTPGVLHAVTVAPTASDVEGATLAAPLRAIFLTQDATSTAIVATRKLGDRIRLDSGFAVDFERPVDLTRASSAFRIDPPVPGRLEAAGDGDGTGFVFRPAAALAAGTTYRVSFVGLTHDADGAPLAPLPELVVTTVDAPAVVRFRPRNNADGVERGAAISVRFTEAMLRRPTERAFSVTVNGAAVKGSFSWAEKDTVLVFQPAAALPYDAKVVARVADGARSRVGAPIQKAASAAFTVESKPAPPPAPRPATPTTKPPTSSSGGGTVSGSSWASVERYYLGLMNCTRTGGWVSSTGKCTSPGGRNVAPLKLDSGITTKVARPYAKLLATRGLCSHFIGGNPGDRLRRAGYTSYRWAENIGCRSGNPSSAVLGSHLYFQSEKPYNGGHYRNLMDARYDRVGIGVWVSSGRVRLVVDFYHP